MRPTVVVLAHDRPKALTRLLDSVAAARYPATGGVRLVISVDGDGDPAVVSVAEAFRWHHGPKELKVSSARLGLVGHFHDAGSLAAKYGSIVLLEDDIVVSPAYYAFAARCLAFYGSDQRVAGVSLYSLWFNGYNHHPFVPWMDGSDVFFLQIPFYVGQAFTDDQWARYETWRSAADVSVSPTDPVHPSLFDFGPDEWFPERIKYLVATARTFVFPRQSLSTGFGDPGTHFRRPTRWFQAAMQWSHTGFRLTTLDSADAVYDSFFEMLPDRLARIASRPELIDCDVDMYASKPMHALGGGGIITSRPARASRERFGRVMWPMEANIVRSVAGSDLSLTACDELKWGRWPELQAEASLLRYFTRGRVLSWRRRLALRLAGGP